jgi:hypothetical protein
MEPLLIVKTANGYALVPFKGCMPSIDLAQVKFAQTLTSSYRGKSVADLLDNHFERPVQLAEAA